MISPQLLFARQMWRVINYSHQCAVQRSIFSLSRSHVKCNLNSCWAEEQTEGRLTNLTSSFFISKRHNKVYPTFDLITEFERYELTSALPAVIEDLAQVHSSDQVQETRAWLSKSLRKNVIDSTYLRCLNIISSYKLLMGGSNSEDLKIIFTLAWCIEILHSCYVIREDIMNSSGTKGGITPWYKCEDVGNSVALNDSILMENGIYDILKLNIKSKPYYSDIIELFQETARHIVEGLGLHLLTAKGLKRKDFTKFTDERYDTIVRLRMSSCSYYLPVALALQVSGVTDESIYERSKEILNDIGRLCQIRDEYLNTFGDVCYTGSDIGEGKCTWFAVNAVRLADSTQMKVFSDHYGKDTPNAIRSIKHLYTELKMPELFKKHEEECSDRIAADIHKFKDIPHEIFTNLF